MKHLVIPSTCVFFGGLAGALSVIAFVRHYTQPVSNRDLVEAQLAQVKHASLITEGHGDKVVWMVERCIEDGLSKTDMAPLDPGSKAMRAALAREVKKVYTNQAKTMPPHVEEWCGTISRDDASTQ